MITLSTLPASLATAPATAPADAPAPADPASAGAPHDATTVDPLAAFGAQHGLHPDVAVLAQPRSPAGERGSTPLLDAKKEPRRAQAAQTAQPSCQPVAASYDVATTTPAQIADLRRCGHGRLADTIEHAQASYADLLSQKPPMKIVVTTSAGNGGEPVMVVTGPRFDPTAAAHVHVHYHGDNATVADPLGSKAGINARVRAVVLNEDPQAVFVLPEAANATSSVDSPTNHNKYSVSWSNVHSQVQTTADALAAAHVTLVGETVVSAHSGGGMALVNLILADPKGNLLKADRLELLDCVYHFGKEQNPRYYTEQRLAEWAKTPNGQAVKQVIFYRGTNDADRAKVLDKAFGPKNGKPTFSMVDMDREPKLFDKKGNVDETVDPVAQDANGRTVEQKVVVPKQTRTPPVAHHYKPDAHYRTSGEFLGAKPRP